MTTKVPDEIDPVGFEARLLECSGALRELVAYLRASAHHAGPGVSQRRFRHPAPNTGWGVTYYVESLPFCELHPKPHEEHVWVLLRGADAEAILAAGFEPSKQPGWFTVRRMGEAVRCVSWILQSYDLRSQQTG